MCVCVYEVVVCVCVVCVCVYTNTHVKVREQLCRIRSLLSPLRGFQRLSSGPQTFEAGTFICSTIWPAPCYIVFSMFSLWVICLN